MSKFKQFQHPYDPDPKFMKRVVYFSMEYAIHQPFKIYSGGLGFLAGSHMRSAYDQKQNLIGIGILWKYGYYDQVRRGDQSMDSLFQEKVYSFLQDTGIKFEITINGHTVWVKAWYLPPKTFNTVPMFFLSTDLAENDYLAQTISHKLYDAQTETRVAQEILLGVGGAKLCDILEFNPQIYHLNEAHALPAAFYLYQKHKSLEKVKDLMVFTTHTPEEAGNEKHDIRFLEKMGFFAGVPLDEVRKITGHKDDVFNLSLGALRLSHVANGVSKLHGEVSREMWKSYENICPIISITNAQNKKYWADKQLYSALEKGDDKALVERKQFLKELLFDVVADQTGKIFDPNVLTIVWARRFAAYKRADLLIRDESRFEKLIRNTKYPVQIIWAGKPYPMDYGSVSVFNNLVHNSKRYTNTAVLVGYELQLSRRLKQGADIWLNNPRVPREASGTSGMTAAMNGAINFSTYDGWIREYSKHAINSYIIPLADPKAPIYEQDTTDLIGLYDVLENEILPTYYEHKDKWLNIVKQSMTDVLPYFDSDRMAFQYYEKLYEYGS